MKKTISVIVTLTLVIAMLIVMSACSQNEESKGTLYSLSSSQDPDVYTVTGLAESAYEGDTVTFKVVLTHPSDSVIDSVETHGTTTGYKTLTPDNEGVYSFVMPAEPISIEIKADYYPDNTTDNFLSWDNDNTTAIEKWQPSFEGDTYFDSFDDATLYSTITSQPSQSPSVFALNLHSEEVFSLDQTVIPDEALKVVPLTQGTGNSVNRFEIRIDRTKISGGTAKLVLIVNNEHKFLDRAVLACTVTVSEPEPLERVNIWTETVVFDISSIENDKNTEEMAFVFEDLDYEENMNLQKSYVFDVKDYAIINGKVTLTLNYAKGHGYSLSFHYYMSEQPSYPSITFEGNSDGGNYASQRLTFDKENGSIEFIVT